MWPRWYEPPLPPMHARRIVSEVARAFGMTPERLRSQSRQRDCVVARGIAVRILRDSRRGDNFRYSTPQIAKIIGRKDHTTVLHALDNFSIWMDYEPDAREVYENLRALAA